MPKPHLPTFADTALSPSCAPIAKSAIGRGNAAATLAPAPPSCMAGTLRSPSLPGAQGWQ